jgi:hypothetical protein
MSEKKDEENKEESEENEEGNSKDSFNDNDDNDLLDTGESSPHEKPRGSKSISSGIFCLFSLAHSKIGKADEKSTLTKSNTMKPMSQGTKSTISLSYSSEKDALNGIVKYLLSLSSQKSNRSFLHH